MHSDSMTMRLSKSQDDDSMTMSCVCPNHNFESQDDDSMTMLMSNSRDDDSMTTCLSNSTLHLPNEDLEGRTNISECVSPGSTFQRCLAQIEYWHPWKVLPLETHSEMFVRPSKSSFGRGNVESRDDDSMTMCMSKSQLRVRMMIAWRCVCPTHKMMIAWRCVFPNQNFTSPKRIFLCSPNEDFGRPNQHFRRHFRSIFQGCDHSIWATSRWKVLRKRLLKCWLGLPKSSFGRGNFGRANKTFQRAFAKHFHAPQTKILEGWTKE